MTTTGFNKVITRKYLNGLKNKKLQECLAKTIRKNTFKIIIFNLLCTLYKTRLLEVYRLRTLQRNDYAMNGRNNDIIEQSKEWRMLPMKV